MALCPFHFTRQVLYEASGINQALYSDMIKWPIFVLLVAMAIYTFFIKPSCLKAQDLPLH
jgi:hypothetical protein